MNWKGSITIKEMCYFMYTPTFEDGIHTCHTEEQDRQAVIVRTNRVQFPRGRIA